MIQSMTGYGKAKGNSNNYTFEVELRSVNNRFLDISVRLPKTLLSKEIELRNLIKRSINRGKVSLSINLSKDDIDNSASNIDNESIIKTVETLTEIKKKANINEEIKLAHLLSFPNLFIIDDLELTESEFDQIKIALQNAIKDLRKMRSTEGEMLLDDLKSRIMNISELIIDINNIGRDSIKEYFLKLKERAAELVEGIQNNDDRLTMELALLSEKYDITEESVRMESHIKQFLHTLENEKEAGKKLNFIVQEMNREVNTIGNKSVSLEITNIGILIKEELEKIREQIQNIE